MKIPNCWICVCPTAAAATAAAAATTTTNNNNNNNNQPGLTKFLIVRLAEKALGVVVRGVAHGHPRLVEVH